jgi:hypothetical protein
MKSALGHILHVNLRYRNVSRNRIIIVIEIFRY